MFIHIYNQKKQKIIDLKKILLKIFLSLNDDKRLNIIFINNSEMQKINFYYRKKNVTTDVLTFSNEINDGFLGDIFISFEKALEQAKTYGHSLKREICFLALHGYLHLKGYTHNTEKKLQEMISIQEKILERHNLNRL